MDAVVVGLVTAFTVGLGTLYWYLLVQPEVVLSLFRDREDDQTWFGEHPSALRALRVVAGGTLLLACFFAGLAFTFLVSTR